MKTLGSFFFLVLLFALTSCQKQEVINGKPNIIVTFSPYDGWVKDIVGDTANVIVAIPPQFNPHLYEASPKDMVKFKNASLWFSIGEPAEKKLIKTLSLHYKNFKNIDLSQNLLQEAIHESCRSSHHDSCLNEESIDRHFWLSPSLALKQCLEIKNYLCSSFPEHKDFYTKNFEKLEIRFKHLISDLTHSLNPIKGQAFITSHAALGYFAKEFHLVQIPIEYEGKSPKPKDLQKIRSFSSTHSVLCALTIEKFDTKGTIVIAHDLNIPMYNFDPQNPEYFKSLRLLAKELLGH